MSKSFWFYEKSHYGSEISHSILKPSAIIFTLMFVASCATTTPLQLNQISSEQSPKGTEQIVNALEIWEDFRRDEKRELLLESISIDPTALAFHLLAQEYLKQQNYLEAFNAYSKAIELDPGFARGYFERGIMSLWKIQNRTWDEAIDDLRLAFQLSPKNLNYAMTLADQVKWNKDTQAEAYTIFETLILEAPENPRVFTEFTRFLMNQNQRSDALVHINSALRLTINSTNIYDQVPLILPLYQLGLVEEAEQYMRTLEVSDTKDYWLLANLGTELTKHGLFSQASRAFSQILAQSQALEYDHGFYFGISEFLSSGNTDPLVLYGTEGNNLIYLSVSEFVSSTQQAQSRADDSYTKMVQQIEKEWGPMRDKRNHIPWLDALLKWRETQN